MTRKVIFTNEIAIKMPILPNPVNGYRERDSGERITKNTKSLKQNP
jgi:hypothetical protein